MMESSAPPTTRQVAEAVLLDQGRRTGLFNYACRRFGIAVEDAEDLLQETAIALLRQRNYVRDPDRFVSAVFRNRCIRFVESRRVRREVFSEAALLDAMGVETPEQIDRRLALRKAFEEISSPCRRLLCAYYVEGQSLREAARRLSLAYSSVAKTISRCLRKLRACLT